MEFGEWYFYKGSTYMVGQGRKQFWAEGEIKMWCRPESLGQSRGKPWSKQCLWRVLHGALIRPPGQGMQTAARKVGPRQASPWSWGCPRRSWRPSVVCWSLSWAARPTLEGDLGSTPPCPPQQEYVSPYLQLRGQETSSFDAVFRSGK